MNTASFLICWGLGFDSQVGQNVFGFCHQDVLSNSRLVQSCARLMTICFYYMKFKSNWWYSGGPLAKPSYDTGVILRYLNKIWSNSPNIIEHLWTFLFSKRCFRSILHIEFMSAHTSGSLIMYLNRYQSKITFTMIRRWVPTADRQ